MAAEIAFDIDLDHGRCVGVRIPAGDAAVRDLAAGVLHPDEQALAGGLAVLRRRTWVGGRVAMRAALDRLGVASPAILANDRGAPVLPAGIAGSITHKEGLAAALVAHEGDARLGLDLELDVVRTDDISARVLTDDELREVASLDAPDRQREVLLRFSAKEAIYKALDPFVRRYVGFREVRVTPLPDGRAVTGWTLREGEGPFEIDVRWRRIEGIVLTSARVVRVP